MTERERKQRASIKKELQKKGILPPNKPRTNRKAYAAEVLSEFYETMDSSTDMYWVMRAIGCMVDKNMKKVSDEEMGIIRMLKLAIEYKKFSNRLTTQGRDSYTFGEFYDEVYAPVMETEKIKGEKNNGKISD